MENKIYIGYITSYFGLKGEVKVKSDTNNKQKVFAPGNGIFIDNKRYIISKSNLNNKIIIALDGFNSIEDIEPFIKKDIYVTRESINLSDDEYLLSELMGMEIIDNNISLGYVKEILLSKKVNYIKNGNLIIPLDKPYLAKVDVINRKVYVNGSKELSIWE